MISGSKCPVSGGGKKVSIAGLIVLAVSTYRGAY